MKYLIVLGDGMADEPLPELGMKTPLQVADTPYMDLLATKGRNGRLSTIPEGFPPGSEIANMSVLGYDVRTDFEGRGSLEAASLGVVLEPGDLALRCNLICIEGNTIKNHSAGHISNQEAGELIRYLNESLGSPDVRFYEGFSYRHLLVIKGGDKRLHCTPPHDVPGTPWASVLIQSEHEAAQATADRLNELIRRSQALLAQHPINLSRQAAGKDMANSIWPWSPGYKPAMKTLMERFPIIQSGSVISAVDLIKGIGVYAGLTPLLVEGATGLHDTNYEGKAAAALHALKKEDFVFLHVEASDEASHEGDVALKIKTIEYLDKRIIGPIYEVVKSWEEPVAIAVLPDHPTWCRLKTHVNEPIPFILYKPGVSPDAVIRYDESAACEGHYGLLSGAGFMEALLQPEQ
jgi:2,3-bisphosphoglycerate-independent phosphoglycerate mutase